VPRPVAWSSSRPSSSDHGVVRPAQSGSSKPRLTGPACHRAHLAQLHLRKRAHPRDGPPTRPGVVTGASSHGHAALCAVTPPGGPERTNLPMTAPCLPRPRRADRQLGRPTKIIGIREPMRAEHLFWRGLQRHCGASDCRPWRLLALNPSRGAKPPPDACRPMRYAGARRKSSRAARCR
jgi:hypothetical protein